MQTPLFEESLQRDIDRIREHINQMSIIAEKALRDCVRSFIEGNRQLAYGVILRDQFIDEKEKEIDRLCLEFIVRQQPVAGHLRFAYSSIKINLEIERVGDYAEKIARQLLKQHDNSLDFFKESIIKIADLSIGMFHESIKAFVEQSLSLAKKNIEIEQAVDTLRSALNKELVTLLRDGKITFEQFDPLMTIVKRFERVSDQARNICLEVMYMCTGEYAKHPGSEAFRILFIDDHNHCRSQMAEVLAHSMKQPRFIFNSAGLEPEPIEQTFIDFMQKKGFDVSRLVPKAIHQVPNLDHYQVIVALSANGYKAFPQRPPKAIFLDWSVEDPLKKSADPDQLQAAFEDTFKFISAQVQDLVKAILGIETI